MSDEGKPRKWLRMSDRSDYDRIVREIGSDGVI